MKKTKQLTAGALMLALATVLSLLGIKLPFGASITFGSMLPVIVFSYRFSIGKSLLLSFTYSLIQLVILFAPPPVQNFSSFFAVIMLDYVIAFTILGLAGSISKWIKNVKLKYLFGTSVVVTARFLCHFISGVLIWDCYAPAGQSPVLYSLGFNGAYMGCELLIIAVLVILLSSLFEKIK